MFILLSVVIDIVDVEEHLLVDGVKVMDNDIIVEWRGLSELSGVDLPVEHVKVVKWSGVEVDNVVES